MALGGDLLAGSLGAAASVFELGAASIKTVGSELVSELKKYNELQKQSFDLGLNYTDILKKSGELFKSQTVEIFRQQQVPQDFSKKLENPELKETLDNQTLSTYTTYMTTEAAKFIKSANDIQISKNDQLEKTFNNNLNSYLALTKSVDQLTTTLQTRFVITLELFRNRLLGNTEGLVKLATFQEAIGISSKETIAQMKQSAVIGNLSNSQVSNLSQTMLYASQIFGTSTEALVGALNDITPALKMAALGNADTATLANASMIAIAATGEANAADMAKLINFLADPTSDALQTKAMLGIVQSADMLYAAGQTDEQKARLLIDLITQASKSFESTFGGQKTLTPLVLSQLPNKEILEIFSRIGKQVKDINLSIDKAIAESKVRQGINNIFNAIDSAFNAIKEQVQTILDQFSPQILAIVKAIAYGISKGIEQVIGVIKNIFGPDIFGEKSLGIISETARKFTVAFAGMVAGFVKLFITGAEMLADMGPVLMDIFAKLPEMLIGILDYFPGFEEQQNKLREIQARRDRQAATKKDDIDVFEKLKKSLSELSNKEPSTSMLDIAQINFDMQRDIAQKERDKQLLAAAKDTANNTAKIAENTNEDTSINQAQILTDQIRATFSTYFRLQNELMNNTDLQQLISKTEENTNAIKQGNAARVAIAEDQRRNSASSPLPFAPA